MASKFGNRVRNTLNIPFRTLWTAANTVSDSANTVAWVAEDLAKVTNSTADKIRELFNEDKKWYQKILNVPVAAWVWLVSVVEAAVKPVVNWVVNTWKTVRNTVSNARKSTFWSLFSTKPVSDFSYNTRKTKDWVKLVDVHKRTMDPNKLWTSNRWTWKKVNAKSAEKAKTAAAWAATAAAVSSKESSKTAMDDMMKNFEKKLKDMEDSFSKKIQEVLEKNKKLNEQNKKLVEDNKNKDWEIAKLKAEIQWLKKSEAKPEIAEKPAEKKADGWKPEKKEDKPETKEIKDGKRVPEIIKSSKSKKMFSYLQRTHPEIKIKTDNTTWKWKLLWSKSWNMIIIWTKDIENAEHITDHEIAHVMYRDNVAWMQELEGTVRALNDRYGKQLSSVANNDDEYKTKAEKTIEDVCEIIAFYARDDWSFEKHMKKLQSGEDNTLAKISESDAECLRDLCENIFSKLNVVKLHGDAPVSMAA